MIRFQRYARGASVSIGGLEVGLYFNGPWLFFCFEKQGFNITIGPLMVTYYR